MNINKARVRQVAEVLKHLPKRDSGLNFYSFKSGQKEIVADTMYPPLNHPSTIDFFFFVCLHQHGFWYNDDNGYTKPMIGKLDGKESKGSDLLWGVAIKAFNKKNDVFSPANLSPFDWSKFDGIFQDDDGKIFFPDSLARFNLSLRYAQWFSDRRINPKDLVAESNASSYPLKTFRRLLKQVSGYDKDLLEKKNLLLAMTLANRPEKFLKVNDLRHWSPIIDYHLMRLALRLGMVDLSADQARVNIERRWVGVKTEKGIRRATYDAITEVIERSGQSMPFVDEIMWMARKYCPEMTEPDCPQCVFNPVCAHRTKLFQPVFRTNYY